LGSNKVVSIQKKEPVGTNVKAEAKIRRLFVAPPDFVADFLGDHSVADIRLSKGDLYSQRPHSRAQLMCS
jgi:hypothetical protein